MDWSSEGGNRTVPALREALLDYRQLSPAFVGIDLHGSDTPTTGALRAAVADVWDAYQASRYGFVVARLPGLLKSAQGATNHYDGDQKIAALSLLGLTYQAAAVLLTKLGEADLAWIAAERGLQAAQHSGDPVIIGSLFRSVTHALLSTGRYREAKHLTTDAADFLESGLSDASPEYLSVYGTLFLAGAMAAARDEDRTAVREFLAKADESARRIGHDANHLWTAFGPTNVAIHRVATAMDLGDVQVAVDLGPQVDTASLPTERRVRHTLETARALTAWNRTDEAMTLVLQAEQLAPEQVRHHALSRRLVQSWMRRGRGKPSYQLAAVAQRVRVAD